MKKKFLLLFIIFCNFNIFSQQILDSKTCSWNYVLPGQLLCESQETSTGFITLDESRTLTFFSTTGKKKWEKNIDRGQNTYLKVLTNDFILLINNDGKKLQLLNPTGTELWTVFPEEPLSNSVLPGKDGRFFIKNKTSICCYGLNGIKKWIISSLNLSDYELIELNDGSIIAFLNSSDNFTKALRLSPFGEILEEISFSSLIVNISKYKNGLLVNFIDGTSGYVSVINNKLSNIWKIQRKDEKNNYSKDFFISNEELDEILYVSPEKNYLRIFLINPKNGNEINNFVIEDFNIPDFYQITNNGFLISDENHCIFSNFQGKTLFNGFYPYSKQKKYISKKLFTTDNYFILFGNDWNINSFKINQTTKSKISKTNSSKINYNEFYNINPSLFENYLMPEIDSELTSSETLVKLKTGNYGVYENKLIEKLLSGCTAYQSQLFTKNSRSFTESTVFDRDSSGLEKMISLLPLFGTDTFSDFISYLIKYETNRTILNAALISITENGYDPNGKILNNLYLLAKHTNTKDLTIASEICDGVYSICRFMGKPAFNKQGKEIITTFIYPKFNVNIKDYARETLKKISDLDL